MEHENTKPLYLVTSIDIKEETAALKEAASAIIDLPTGMDKQPDLLYFTAIFVSSGENLNHAYFTPYELSKAQGSIINKALDIEHEETEIIGHIYDKAFMDKEGNKLEIADLLALDKDELNKKEIHVAIAGIIYKTRFPDIAEEVAKGDWKVSMETYYRDFDVKIGNLIVSRQEAEVLGLQTSNASVIGKMAKVIKDGVEIASGTLTRVLKDLTFSGCGIVKNPANPPSVILETANALVLSYDNKVTNDILSTKEESNLEHNDTTGICVSYKKEVIDTPIKTQDSKVLHENWCTKYDKACTSSSRDTTDPNCLYTQERTTIETSAYINKALKDIQIASKHNKLIDDLNCKIVEATSLLNNR